MYNIIAQHQNQSNLDMMLNVSDTKSSPTLTTTSNGFKIDCAKECPCGVPVIPVPDQWLEVMVTGGFKVWHIIFIIIAFVITIIVVYCCFHRCRIPRTKQEIEADLMRTNLAQKFSEYLQEFPNEPTTFLEALKKVQELEEKWANEQDDSGAKKRLGWIKLRGKERQTDKAQATDGTGDQSGPARDESGSGAAVQANGQKQPAADDGVKSAPLANNDQLATATDKKLETRDPKETTTAKSLEARLLSVDDKTKSAGLKDAGAKKLADDPKPITARSAFQGLEKTSAAAKERATSKGDSTSTNILLIKPHKSKSEKATELQPTKFDVEAKGGAETLAPMGEHNADSTVPKPAATHQQRPKARRKRDKPNLSRTKAAHVVGSHGESIDANTNVLTLPVATAHRRHPHHSQADHQQRPGQPTAASSVPDAETTTPGKREPRTGKLKQTSRTKKQTVTRGDSTLIQIQTDLSPN